MEQDIDDGRPFPSGASDKVGVAGAALGGASVDVRLVQLRVVPHFTHTGEQQVPMLRIIGLWAPGRAEKSTHTSRVREQTALFGQ